MAGTLESKMTGFRLGDYRDTPGKRGFLGLALALAIGLIPAAYYALRVGESAVRSLRDEQEVLSYKPGTDDTLKLFDELDSAVGMAHRRSMRNTAVIWVLVASGTLIGWYRIT
jgi:hypothetical protein